MKKYRLFSAVSLAIIFAVYPAFGQPSPQFTATLDRMFNKHEFTGGVNSLLQNARWLHDGAAYTTVEPSTEIKGGHDIVQNDTATGKAKRPRLRRKIGPYAGCETPER